MACALEKNGHIKPIPPILYSDLKILVVGESKCGKTTFIKAFYDRNGDGDVYQMGGANVYPCQFDSTKIKIFEVFGGANEFANKLTEKHKDSRGFVFMYAIDDPSSFDNLSDLWMQTVRDNNCWDGQASVLIGNKKDLRENQQAIERLEQENLQFVTEEQGIALSDNNQIAHFFECSSRDENDRRLHDAFDFLITLRELDLRRSGANN